MACRLYLKTRFAIMTYFKRAELLYLFADENRRHYHLSIPAVTKHYKSSGYKDELVWAAAWVYRATGNDVYLKQVNISVYM